MKLATIFLSACAAQATVASHVHLRVSEHKSAPGAWQPCTEAVGCSDQLTCVRQSPEYAQCMPLLKLGELCGRYVADRPEEASQNWEASCVEGLVCALKDGKDMRCVNADEVEYEDDAAETPDQATQTTQQQTTQQQTAAPSTVDQSNTRTARLWEPCGGQGWTATCVDSVCVKESEWYSQCMPAELDDGMLCGQNGDQKWQHTCKAGLQCVQKDGKDMRCAKQSKHKKGHNKSNNKSNKKTHSKVHKKYHA